jgi:hyperosmotically inducible protein
MIMKKIITIIAFTLTLAVGAIAYAEKSAGEHVDDATLTARVKLALLEQSVSDAMDINVESSNGVVQLAGFVGSENAKGMAGRVAGDVDGVNGVSNRLRVQAEKRSAGRALDDGLLAAKVKYALIENKATSGGKINVEIRDALVELSGFVDSYEERDAAVEMVSGIDGVKDVINSIDITQ